MNKFQKFLKSVQNYIRTDVTREDINLKKLTHQDLMDILIVQTVIRIGSVQCISSPMVSDRSNVVMRVAVQRG